MNRNKVIKLRTSAAFRRQVQLAADQRHLSVSEFIRQSIDAAIVGKIDQDALQQHLRTARRAINAASEATNKEGRETALSIAKLCLSNLRGHNG